MPFLDHFSLIAPYYDRWFQTTKPDKLLALLDLQPAGIVLDAGGGTGRVSEMLHGKAAAFVVADVSHGMLLQAQSKAGLSPVCAKTERLPFANGQFERIMMVDVLHHVQNHRHTINELWRVLKEDGRIVIEEPDIRRLPIKLVAIFEKMALMRSHFLDCDSIARLFVFPQASVKIETELNTIWVIIDKIVLAEAGKNP
jgi:ubiquinone/menaquinone biosynthesis C-methylase UbiE